ncbi:hypothetical protein [Brevundimonas sp. TSRC1-1]|uniref:DUF4870 family protein n=1 Tax=Brevundimonas sp. TSRC1-1 TaxID=2804562 RepID=UPI003CEAF0E1
MAEPGDPTGPGAAQDDHDHDAHVGFVSPASLAGRPRAPEPAPAVSKPLEREPDLFDPPEPAPVSPVFAAEARPEPRPEPGPFDRTEPFTAARETRFSAGRERAAKDAQPPRREPVGGNAPQTAPMSLYAVYVLILLAVPTLGVAAVLALLAVTGRDGPQEPVAASHFIYQQRTLWSAAVAVVLGALLVIVNIGVFVLFLLALWVLARGVFGVMRLKAGRPIDNPRTWLF